jgi:TRAP-type mannitol/chloroaromatic compound transport system substrate-binding protein
LDLAVDSPFWPGVVNMETQSQNVIALGKKPESYDATNYSTSDDDTSYKFRNGFVKVLDKIIEQADNLTKQDSDVGDGDLGIGACRAAKSTLKMINSLDF